MMPHQAVLIRILVCATTFSILLAGCALTDGAVFALRAETSEKGPARAHHYRTELFGKKYRLDDSKGLAAYINALDTEIERSKKEQPLGEAHEKDPLHNREPKNFIDKKMRRAMQETRT